MITIIDTEEEEWYRYYDHDSDDAQIDIIIELSLNVDKGNYLCLVLARGTLNIVYEGLDMMKYAEHLVYSNTYWASWVTLIKYDAVWWRLSIMLAVNSMMTMPMTIMMTIAVLMTTMMTLTM